MDGERQSVGHTERDRLVRRRRRRLWRRRRRLLLRVDASRGQPDADAGSRGRRGGQQTFARGRLLLHGDAADGHGQMDERGGGRRRRLMVQQMLVLLLLLILVLLLVMVLLLLLL